LLEIDERKREREKERKKAGPEGKAHQKFTKLG